MAVKRGKIYARQRQNLGEIAPIEAPFSIQIDVCSVCNMRCKFCFHSDYDAIERNNVKFGMMDYKLFQKIINDMCISWGGRDNFLVKKLRLFAVGEPLLNSQLPQMISYAKSRNVAECIELTTNGTLLNAELNREIINAGLDIINISVNGIDAQSYLKMCDYKIDFEKYLITLKDLYTHKGSCKVYIKFSDTGLSEQALSDFYDIFGDCCDEIFVERIMTSMWQDTNIDKGYTNEDKGLYGQKTEQKNVCPFLFTTMVINNEGIAHLCCVDWQSKYVLGDLRSNTIESIWNGDKLRHYRIIHLMKGKQEVEICRKCQSLSYSTTDNIDKYSNDILKRMS